MDESYLSWLRLTPGVSWEIAKAIRDRYPDAQLLRVATAEELQKVPGVTADLASLILRIARRDDRQEESRKLAEPSLYLCPECGFFVGKGAADCMYCGATFEGSEEPEPEPSVEIERLLLSRDGAVKICTRCGAYLDPGVSSCLVCATQFTAAEVAELPAADTRPLPEGDESLCPHCGAYLLDDATACLICGHGGAREKIPESARNGKGVSRDFLSRWQRSTMEDHVAPDVGVPEIEEELRSFERLLEADPTLERAWARRGRILLTLGRIPEAIQCLDRAGGLNPSKDEQYRQETLAALGPAGDASILPPRWAPNVDSTAEARTGEPVPAAASEPLPDVPVVGKTTPSERRPSLTPTLPGTEVYADENTLEHLDRLLRIDATQRAVWETKGELLRKLGRIPEAEECLQRAAQLEVAESTVARSSRAGLETGGLVRAGREMGGARTGRTNGRVNGLTNGRVNGVRTGRVNGLTNGAGRVNGVLGGLTLGGRTNGLVNGDGFTNGRRDRFAGPAIRGKPWARSMAGVASVVLVLVLVPILLSMFTAPAGVTGIVIDGSFADWSQVPLRFVDRATDEVINPDVNLVAYKVAAGEYVLQMYAQVEGLAFRGAGNGTDILVALVDADGRSDTGYDAGVLGADYAVELYGWDVRVYAAQAFRFDSTNRADWHGFHSIGAAAAAASGSEVEFSIELDNPAVAEVLLVAEDILGSTDIADAVIRPGIAALAVREIAIAPGIILSSVGVDVLRLDIWPTGPAAPIEAVNVTMQGTLPDGAVALHLYRDDGDGVVGPGDLALGSARVIQGRASFPAVLTIGTATTLLVAADFTTLQPNETFGLTFDGFKTLATVTVDARDPFLAYLLQAPEPTVDGAFGDWSAVARSQDAAGDVMNRTGSPAAINANIDIVETGSYTASAVSFFLRVDGTMLGGVDVPNLRSRSPPPGERDTDLDTVPDNVEFGISPGLAYDFDNDNVTDALETGDTDSDGTLDYGEPGGTDLWLNTTIPGWYPAPYAGRAVTRYIGPVAPPVFEGVDSAIVYVDADASTATGLPATFGTSAVGFDWAIVVLGRHGRIVSSDVYRYVPGAARPWERVATVPSAVDAHRLEVAVPSALLNVSANYRAIYYATDWTLSYDYHWPVAGRALATRAPAGNEVVINEVASLGATEWIELANPMPTPVSLRGWSLVLVGGRLARTIYAFTGETIGSWGSGTEFLTVFLAAASLPDAQGTVALLDASGRELDRTRYVRLQAGRTWARFKDPNSGLPMDSNRDGRDFYVSSVPTPSTWNDEHRPTLVISKSASTNTAGPGDVVTYTITINNAGTGTARNAWVNDTLPSDVAFLDASLAPVAVAGPTLSWELRNVVPGSQTNIRIRVTVDIGVADRAVLSNRVTADYTDQLDHKLASTTAWRNITIARPVIRVEKVASPSTARPGDTVVFTIYYNNTGSVRAADVWITDVLPSESTIVRASVRPLSVSGQVLTWRFRNVAVGPHSLTVTVILNLNPTSSQFVNWVFLNYTSQNRVPLESSSDSATVSIPEFTDFGPLALIPILFIMVRLWSRNGKKSYSG